VTIGRLHARCATNGKRGYATEEAAQREARALAFIAGGKVMRAYPCPWCAWWHLTRTGGTPLPAEDPR
jgi:hypothetical protein